MASDNGEDDPKIYLILGEINGKIDGLVEMQSKVIYALIALAGATVGLKLMGSPPLLVISSFLNSFVFLFAAILAGHRRKRLIGWQYILTFGVLGIAGNMHKIVLPPNLWLTTCIFIVANSSMVLFLWRWDKWGK